MGWSLSLGREFRRVGGVGVTQVRSGWVQDGIKMQGGSGAGKFGKIGWVEDSARGE